MPAAKPQNWFATTHWSVVLAARDHDPDRAAQALEQLCRTYWYPLYGYLRRQGHQPADAEDLVQGLVTRLLQRDFLRNVTPEKGRFRAFLLGCLRHFVANQRERASAQKRGGGRVDFSLEEGSGEQRYLKARSSGDDPERFYERQWAMSVIATTLDGLGKETAAGGSGALFEALRGALAGEKATPGYAEVAQRLGMSEAAVRSAAHRLRERYRALFREEIAQTVQDPAEVEDEIRHLFRVLEA